MQHVRTLIGMLLLLFVSPVGAQRSPLAGIDDYVEKSMADWRVPGVAIAVVQNDASVLLKGYGVRQVGKPAPVDENTLFYGVIHASQLITAALATLVDDNKVSWDDPVAKHLPWFFLPDPWVTREATIRDLLAERLVRDALPGDLYNLYPDPRERAEVARRTAGPPPQRARFRDQFVYNPSNAYPVAAIIEALTEMPWSQFVRSRILDPMGLSSGGLLDLWSKEDLRPCYVCNRPGPPVGIERARVPNIAMGHFVTENGVEPLAWSPGGLEGPAGQSARDAAKWLRLQLGRGTYEGRRIVSAASIDEIQTPQIIVRGGPYYDIPADVSELWSHGLDSFIGSYRGHKVVLRQTGLGSGFRSFIAMIPSLNLGVAVLSNANIRSAPSNHPMAIALRILDAYLQVPERDWSGEYLAKARAVIAQRTAAQKQLEASRIPGTKPSLPLQDYAGTYTTDRARTLAIEARGGKLFARLDSGLEGALDHWHWDVFVAAWDGPEQFRDDVASFSIGADGRVDGARFSYSGEFRRARPPQAPVR